MHKLISFAVASLQLLGCASIQGSDRSPAPASPSAPAVSIESHRSVAQVEKSFGGPYDFEVEFSPVTDAVAKEFWSSLYKEDAFTQPPKPSEKEGSSRASAVKDSYPVVPVLKRAAEDYVARLSGWVKTLCVSPDMNKLQKGQLTFKKAVRKIPAEYYFMDAPSGEELLKKYRTLGNFWAAMEKKESEYESIFTCSFEKIHRRDLRKGQSNPLLQPDALAKSEWRLSADPRRIFITSESELPLMNVYVGLSAVNSATKERWYGTRFSAFSEETKTESEDGPGVYPVAISFFAVDQYLIPSRTHTVSKGLTVPVAKFDLETGKITAFYDFGLLMLHRLKPDDPVTLTTVISEDKAKKYLQTGDPSLFGSRAGAERGKNEYVDAERFPANTPYWRYDRIPTGSVHFMANAFWSDAASSSSNNALLVSLKRDQLIDLYLKGGAWINTYDQYYREGEHIDSKRTYDQLMAGGCAELHPVNLPHGMWLSHEIIIGGERGRKLIFETAKPTVVLNGCGKK